MSRLCFAAAALAAACATAAPAQDAADSRRAELLRQRAAIDAELSALDVAAPVVAARAATVSMAPDDIVVTGRALTVTTRVTGQTSSQIDRTAFRDTPATTIADIVKLAPGVTVIGGNGPRDVGVSIRGSNARNSFGARNIQVFEDDFPVTQPDGLARFDLTDPHAYGAVDVVRGPSSARYGNYAIGGAINFRTRRGRDVDGIEIGLDGGSQDYANLYATVGGAGASHDYSLFGSFVRADGFTGHTGYETGTLNGLATFQLGYRDRVAAKIIYNEGEFRLSTRLSFNQYLANPYQRGCERAATAAAGCGTIAVLANGVNGARIAQTADEADLARNDRRTIAGVRWEHDLSSTATWRTQGVFDARVVNQPTSANPFKGTLNSYQVSTDVTERGRLLGMEAVRFIQLSYGYLDNQSVTFNKTPAGRNGIGAPLQTVFGDVRNLGLRARQELRLAPDLQLVTGIGVERSIITARQTSYVYPLAATAVLTVIPARRQFTNIAPEASLTWTASEAVELHARVGTGYGIPQTGQLFVTSAGVPGNNATLKTQRNVGIDLGVELAFGDMLTAELTGYHEWFRNEQVSQSPGVNLLAFTTNVPRSVHRGLELGLTLRPFAAARGAYARVNYAYADQTYTRYIERLTTGAVSAAFDRDGNRIPGVVPHFLNARMGHDQADGALAGLSGFAELGWRSRYVLDNANLLEVPAATLVNLNLSYDPPGDAGWRRLSLFASVQNLFDRTFVGSASPVANSLDAAGRINGVAVLRGATGSIYAGQPRTVIAGVRSRF